MAKETGNLSINSENIFPIIKKWLYSDHDIFMREMISNGCDAITKLRKLEIIGEYQFKDGFKPKITVIADPEKKTLKFIDNGIGMTADEVKEFICQIAFSGAEAFLNEYKDKTNEDQIIGHFGLGFYSAFMVADKVSIDSLSYREGAKAVYWECDGGTDYTMSDSERSEVGTEITLYLNEDCLEFCNEYRVRDVLNKYCAFMPEEIYFINAEVEAKKAAEAAKKESEKKSEDKAGSGADKDAAEKAGSAEDSAEGTEDADAPKPINDPHPLWTKHPNNCTEEEYKEFYRKVFMDYREPLFWIHLNMDYPFNLKGILYFPRLTNKYESIEGVIKLYNNQVFIADNIKEVIPEFLLLLRGVIDCPDLPLNVSRSALQNDGFVTKISDYISKKVADKLSGMCKTEKEEYEKYWDDISPFIKFGCLRDEKFCEKMSEYILFKNLDDKYLTLPECLEENKDRFENTVFYVTDKNLQSQYINMFRAEGLDAVYLEHLIDSSFITQLEAKNEGVKFKRIDTDIAAVLAEEDESSPEAAGADAEASDESSAPKTGGIEGSGESSASNDIEASKSSASVDKSTISADGSSDSTSEASDGVGAQASENGENPNEPLTSEGADSESQSSENAAEAKDELAKKIQSRLRALTGSDKLEVQLKALKNAEISSVIAVNEENRRMEEMMIQMGFSGPETAMYRMPGTLILNKNNELVKYVLEHEEGEASDMVLEQLYDLAKLANEPLSPDEMTKFIARSNRIMKMFTQ